MSMARQQLESAAPASRAALTPHQATIDAMRLWMAAEFEAWRARFAIHGARDADLAIAVAAAAEARAQWEAASKREDEVNYQNARQAARAHAGGS